MGSIPFLERRTAVVQCAWESDNAGCGNSIDIQVEVVLGEPYVTTLPMRLFALDWVVIADKPYCPDCKDGMLDKMVGGV